MKPILATILETKQAELESMRAGARATVANGARRSLAQAIRSQQHMAVIAEVKKASPSRGVIRSDFNPTAIARAYARGGACAVSVLTDQTYFQGSIEHLRAVRATVALPILRKDFIIDERQIDESLGAGADAVLLIAAALTPRRLAELSAYAQALGLEVLVEVHDSRELDAALAAQPTILGVNNRDLGTFDVRLGTTREVLRDVPDGVLAISESGIHTRRDAEAMARFGARGILVGEALMREATDDAVAARIRELQVPLDGEVIEP